MFLLVGVSGSLALNDPWWVLAVKIGLLCLMVPLLITTIRRVTAHSGVRLYYYSSFTLYGNGPSSNGLGPTVKQVQILLVCE